MSEIQSLARGLKILDILGQAQDGVSITELAAFVMEVGKSLSERMTFTRP